MIGELLQGGAALLDFMGAQQQNRRNEKLFFENQQWETQMSSTAVQRRAADIRRAGGNPALAFTGGQEASTPSTTPPQMQNEMAGPAEIMANASAKLMAIKAAKAGIEKTNSETALNTASAANVAKQGALIDAQTMGALNTGRKTLAELDNLSAAKKEILARADQILTDTQTKKLELEIHGKTKQDLIDLAHSQATAARLGIAQKDWESVIYGALKKFVTPGDSTTVVPIGKLKPPNSGIAKQPYSQRHGSIKR